MAIANGNNALKFYSEVKELIFFSVSRKFNAYFPREIIAWTNLNECSLHSWQFCVRLSHYLPYQSSRGFGACILGLQSAHKTAS